jgi:hypothetical protein
VLGLLYWVGCTEVEAQVNITIKPPVEEVQVPPNDTVILRQEIRGQVMDNEAKFPMPGAHVMLKADSSDQYRATSTGARGNFRFENVRVGRYLLKVSHIGYKPVVQSVLLSSSRELILNILLEELPGQLDDVIVQGDLTPIVPAGSHVINTDELNRHAGNRGETVRKVTVLAGIQSGDDSRNDVVVRGNAPGSVMWRLEGLNIPNPNHFNIPGTSGGPVSLINDKMLGSSAFYSGAFPAGFGNTTSGIFDLYFREGNNQKFNHTIQAGVLGAELSSEGPLLRDKSSYLFSFRTATLKVFQKFGLDIGTEAVPRYTDAAFNVNVTGKGNSSFSVFGLGGVSHVDILISTGIKNFYGEKDRDQDFDAKTGIVGVSYKNSINSKTYLSAAMALSGASTSGFHKLVYPPELRQAILVCDNQNNADTLPPVLHYDFRETRISNTFSFTKRLKRQGSILTAGFTSDYYFFHFVDSVRNTDQGSSEFCAWQTRWMSREGSWLFQPYVQWKYASKKIDLSVGLHSQYFSLSGSYSIAEPRIGFKYYVNDRQHFSMGLGLHSQIQAPYLYFYGDSTANGKPVPHNKKMNFTRSVHSVVGYEHLAGPNERPVRIKSELYYQWIYNVPVEVTPTSFSLLNTGATYTRFYPGLLVNEGVGKNYGLEVTADRTFAKGYLFLVTGSLFQSRYKGSDNIWRNTDFNGNYMANILATKEWINRKQNIFSVGTRISTAGGRRYGPVDELASEEKKDVVFVDSTLNTQQFKPYFRTDIRLSYKINLSKVSHEIAVDMINIFFTRNVLKLTYVPDINQTGKGSVAKEYQLGFLPFLYYRLDF